MNRVFIAILTLSVAACSSGGQTSHGAAPLPAAPSASARVKILVPAPVRSAARTRNFVSPSTAGVLAQVYAHSDAAHANLLAESATDISSGSAACGGTTGTPRTCTYSIPAPPGDDDFVITTYDAPPVAGSFSTANQLAAGVVSGQTIVQGASNTLNVTLGGIIASLGIIMSPASLHGTQPGTVRIDVTPFDSDQNVIITDGFVDALGNPVSINLTASPNAALFTITPSSLSAPTTSSIVMTYTGTATAAFAATVTATAGSATATATETISGPQVIEYTSTSGSGPYGIAKGSDGRLWFAQDYTNQIGAMTPSGTVTEYNVPSSNAGLQGLTAGSDGRLYFIENETGKIGAVTTAGVFTEYTVSVSGDPDQIAEGPDNRVWCTLVDTDNLCALTTSGTNSTYAAAPGSANPAFVTAGPDGNMWYTTSAGINSYVNAMSTSGAPVYSYPVGSGAFLFGIAAGSDGRLWFCDTSNNYIWAVTTGGALTHYSIPTGSSGPWSIVAGPDGNLWFTEQAAGKIGRITTSGVITEYLVPSGTNAYLYYITVGPDGNLWFTEGQTGYIGEMIW